MLNAMCKKEQLLMREKEGEGKREGGGVRERERQKRNVQQSPDITPPNAGHFYKLSIKSDHTRREREKERHPKLLMCVCAFVCV